MRRLVLLPAQLKTFTDIPFAEEIADANEAEKPFQELPDETLKRFFTHLSGKAIQQ